MKKINWVKNDFAGNYILNNGKGKVYISYQPNALANIFGRSDLDSGNPETAIVLIDDKKVSGELAKFLGKKTTDRFLIFRGDKRKQLEKLYPNIAKLKAYWKKEGGHFWSDSLED